MHFAFKGFHRYSSSSNYNQRNQSHKPNAFEEINDFRKRSKIWRNVCQNAKKFHSIPIILRSTNFDDSLRELAYEVVFICDYKFNGTNLTHRNSVAECISVDRSFQAPCFGYLYSKGRNPDTAISIGDCGSDENDRASLI